ncbi:hypothetical protein H696_00708 [Fonticula alba]|uniref:ABC transporter domain-containing protein n=1 Tax=Fonticula alba TaxID=691883 RepID=A0A058ZFK1_FONAL|nr:hypothetical protein H696_00708 [Fonticula alba]KCV73165.1 hypothetical protein H696_00708 [Fonticula alba]|eukprot:XP_009492866.1 hypothetical protein H696_00708 [Fonticula alba]
MCANPALFSRPGPRRPAGGVDTAPAGYVLQDDHHLKYLTVREVLTYAARLRAATSIPRDRIEARVQETINLLGLRNVADSRVGGSGIEAISVRGLSGGERRRVSIGVQLVGDPAVLFLDEPTTGLDSFTANTIVATLRALAQRHQKTIIFTVHQPRSDIFALLDKVLLMSQGRAVFFGHRAGLIDHFTRAGFPCGLYENPLDFYIDTIAVDKRSLKRMADAESRLLYLLAAYDASDSKAALEREIAVAGSSPALAPSSDLDVAYPDSNVLLARIARNLARSPMDVLDRIYMLPFVGILMLLFMQNVGNDQISVQNRTGLLFEALSVSPVMGMMNAIAQFPEHRKLFTRSDSRDARYSGFELVSAYFLVALPLGILASLLFTAITIYPFGLQTGWVRFFTLFGTSILLYMVGELLGVVTIALLDDQTAANNTSSLLLSSSLLLGSGILRSPLTAPSWIGKGLKYAAPHFYASQLMFVSEYQDLDLTCTPRPGFEDVLQPGFCRFPSGNAYLTMLFPGAEDHELRNWLVLGAYVLLMWLLTSTVFTIVGKLKRR